MTKTVYNAYGSKITAGETYYTIKHISVSQASGKYYTDLGYKTPVTVRSQLPVIVRTAKRDYKCDLCGQDIYWGNLYAKPGAKFATDKFCIDCISPFKEEDQIEEVK